MSYLPPHERRARARRQAAIRRRRIIAVAGTGALLLLGVIAIISSASGRSGGGGERARAEAPPPPPQLPRGGRSIFPEFRVVGFAGAPQADELGELGIGSPDQAARKLERQARPYGPQGAGAAGGRGGPRPAAGPARPAAGTRPVAATTRPVAGPARPASRPNQPAPRAAPPPYRRPILPAFELLAAIANGSPGDDGKYRTRQKKAVIRRYLQAARRAHAVLMLDIQPGRADFMDEVKVLDEFLAEPDVSLSLDPEWHMSEGQVPGQTIGSVTAGEVNQVAAHLSQIVQRRKLPEKLLVVHQFTEDMIKNRPRLRQYPGVALTLNVDGFGTQKLKTDKYDEFVRTSGPVHHGFKLFYREDTNMMKPRDVLRLRPEPEFVVYE